VLTFCTISESTPLTHDPSLLIKLIDNHTPRACQRRRSLTDATYHGVVVPRSGIDAFAEPCHIPGNGEMNHKSHQGRCLIPPQLGHHDDFTI
jgi:hypothetical protein